MIGDNIIAYDTLECAKSSIKSLTSAAMEAGNQNLKQTFLQMRNQAEKDQEKIYQISEQNGWYIAAGQANPQEISKFNNFFHQNYQHTQMQNMGYGGGNQFSQQGYRVRTQNQQRSGVQQPEYQSSSLQQNY